MSGDTVSVLDISILCDHNLGIIALETSTRNLFEAILHGIELRVKSTRLSAALDSTVMISRLPLFVDGSKYNPRHLTVSPISDSMSD